MQPMDHKTINDFEKAILKKKINKAGKLRLRVQIIFFLSLICWRTSPEINQRPLLELKGSIFYVHNKAEVFFFFAFHILFELLHSQESSRCFSNT